MRHSAADIESASLVRLGESCCSSACESAADLVVDAFGQNPAAAETVCERIAEQFCGAFDEALQAIDLRIKERAGTLKDADLVFDKAGQELIDQFATALEGQLDRPQCPEGSERDALVSFFRRHASESLALRRPASAMP